MHDMKIAELRKAQAKALTTAARSSSLTPEQVEEIRLKVLGIA